MPPKWSFKRRQQAAAAAVQARWNKTNGIMATVIIIVIYCIMYLANSQQEQEHDLQRSSDSTSTQVNNTAGIKNDNI